MPGPDEDWESDGEFEQSVLELDLSMTHKSTAAEPTSSTFSIVTISKLSKIQPTTSSTPLPSTQHTNPAVQQTVIDNNNDKGHKLLSPYSKHAPNCKESQLDFMRPSAFASTASIKRKRRFPGPAGTLPKLVCLCQYQFAIHQLSYRLVCVKSFYSSYFLRIQCFMFILE